MKDNDLIALLSAQLNLAVTAGGWDFPVIQKQQPTQQGIPYAPAVFFEKLFDYHYGWAETDYPVYDPSTNMFDESETQNLETTFQISAWVIQNPADLTIPTASDVVNFLKMFMTSRSMVRTLMSNAAEPINIQRVTQVRNPYIEDDRHRNEATPNFDLVFSHKRILVNKIGAVDEAICDGIFPV